MLETQGPFWANAPEEGLSSAVRITSQAGILRVLESSKMMGLSTGREKTGFLWIRKNFWNFEFFLIFCCVFYFLRELSRWLFDRVANIKGKNEPQMITARNSLELEKLKVLEKEDCVLYSGPFRVKPGGLSVSLYPKNTFPIPPNTQPLQTHPNHKN